MLILMPRLETFRNMWECQRVEWDQNRSARINIALSLNIDTF